MARSLKPTTWFCSCASFLATKRTLLFGCRLLIAAAMLLLLTAAVTSSLWWPGLVRGASSRLPAAGALDSARRPVGRCQHLSSAPQPFWTSAMLNFSCPKLFTGDAAELAAVRNFLDHVPRPEPCYRDSHIGCASCSELVAAFRRPFDFTDDERDFPLAYGLRVHTCATQVELLLRAIYSLHNVYCLHVDGRSPRHFVAAMHRLAACLPNVLLAPIDEDFVYASSSQMEADLECMRVVRESPVRWRYFINLAGQELPLRTNYELVQMLRSLNGSSHVYIEPPGHFYRQTHSVWCREPISNRTVECPEPRRPKPPPPDHVTIYKGYANAEFSRAFVDYVLDADDIARRLYEWLSDTLCPEEHFYPTLLALPGTPGGVWSGVHTRLIFWYGLSECATQFVREICIITSPDLHHLVGRPEPFVNKLHFERDPVAVSCLVESVMKREAEQHAQARPRRKRRLLSSMGYRTYVSVK